MEALTAFSDENRDLFIFGMPSEEELLANPVPDREGPSRRSITHELHEAKAITRTLVRLAELGIPSNMLVSLDKPLFELVEGEGEKERITPLFSVMDILETVIGIGKRGVEKIEQLPLTPRRAMRHLTGPLARLTARPTDTEDYIWATLTDPTPLPDAMAQLRAAYPNAMRLDYLPQGEVAHPLDMTQAVRGKPFVELFQDFFTKMNGRPLTVEETVAVKRLREEASKSE